MSKNYDEPLFKDSNEAKSKNSLELEKLRVRQDEKKFNKILTFASKIIIGIVILIVVLIIFDIISQCLEMDNSLIKDCFSLLKYTLTSVLGFVFGSNYSNHNSGN